MGTARSPHPVFVSAHNHLGYAVFRGLSEDVGLRCSTGQYFPMGTVISREERCAVGSLHLAELLRGGVTTVLEMEEDADVFAPIVEQIGSRAAMGVMIHDVDVDLMAKGEFSYDADLRASLVRQAVHLAEQWHGKADGRITVMMTPNMTISSSPGLLRAMREAADKLGLRLSIHLGWGAAEKDIIGRLHGMSPFEYVRENGLLASDVVAAHCYHVDDADIALLEDSGAHVAHCPVLNSIRGCIAPVLDYRKRDITVGLGLDNYFSDYFDVIRSCISVARILAKDAEVMQAPDALELATIGPARALGLDDEIGSLEPGKRADIQIVDFRTFGLTPRIDAIRSLVYHAHAKDVDMVLVDGQPVVENGELKTVNAADLIDGAQTAATAAWSKFVDKYGGYMAG